MIDNPQDPSSHHLASSSSSATSFASFHLVLFLEGLSPLLRKIRLQGLQVATTGTTGKQSQLARTILDSTNQHYLGPCSCTTLETHMRRIDENVYVLCIAKKKGIICIIYLMFWLKYLNSKCMCLQN